MLPLTRPEYHYILRRDLTSFNHRTFYELNPGRTFISSPHIEVMATALEDCRLGKTKRVILNLPPRSLKSHSVSVSFVAWLMGHNPSAQIICASYNQDLANKHARDTRTVMNSTFYNTLFPGTKLSSEKSSVEEFLTTAQGFRMATSVEGTLTGRGSDFIIIDDPLKPDEALSGTRLKSCNDWYDNTLYTRLNDKETGCIIIVMQRLHQDDLVGHVLDQEDWKVVSFPAIAETNTIHQIAGPLGHRPFRRNAGDALDPQRESLVTLKRMQTTIGRYNFQSQYQQNPMPLGGMIIESSWLRYYEPGQPLPPFALILQSWDTANKAGELNDFSVCTTWGVHNGQYYLLNVYRRRLNYPDLKRAVRDQAHTHQATEIVIEDKASGTQLIQDLQADGVLGIKPYEPLRLADKQMRLHAQSAEFESGRVLLPRTATWLNDYIRELTSFPASKYDDQVDSTTQALDYLKRFNDLAVWIKLGEQHMAAGGTFSQLQMYPYR